MRKLECIFHEYNPQTTAAIFLAACERVMTKSEQCVQLTCERFQIGLREKLCLGKIASGIFSKQL
jgi:hypothetical protein